MIADTRGTARSESGEDKTAGAVPLRRSSRVLRRSCKRAVEKYMPDKPPINTSQIAGMVLSASGKEAVLAHHERLFDAHTGGELADLEARCNAMATRLQDLNGQADEVREEMKGLKRYRQERAEGGRWPFLAVLWALFCVLGCGVGIYGAWFALSMFLYLNGLVETMAEARTLSVIPLIGAFPIKIYAHMLTEKDRILFIKRFAKVTTCMVVLFVCVFSIVNGARASLSTAMADLSGDPGSAHGLTLLLVSQVLTELMLGALLWLAIEHTASLYQSVAETTTRPWRKRASELRRIEIDIDRHRSTLIPLSARRDAVRSLKTLFMDEAGAEYDHKHGELTNRVALAQKWRPEDSASSGSNGKSRSTRTA